LRPTVLFSHGLGGSRAAGEVWGRHWASHGFVVIHLQHPGSDEALWRNRGATPVKEALLAGFTPAAYIDRVVDVKFAVDEIERRRRNGDPVAVRIDADRLGISGHSFGARTTLAIAGERVPGLPATRATGDARFKAGVALSPTAPGAPAGWPERFGAIRMPLLSITGTDDGDPFGKGSPALRTEPWRHMPPPHKYLLVLDGADHYVFGGGDAPRRRVSGHDADIQRLTKAASLRFWQAWLEGDAHAQAWLADAGTRGVFAGYGIWSVK
jgi:predicted dienelactone hydrolase